MNYNYLIFFLIAYQGVSLASIDKKHCRPLDKKIATVNSKLRAGYTTKQGEKLKNKLRELQKKRYACKKKRYKTSS